MSATPNIDKFRANFRSLQWTHEGLLQEIDALQAKSNAAPAPPVRVLREYKSIANPYSYRCRDGVIEVGGGSSTDWLTTASIREQDAEGIAALRADPFVPLPDVRSAVLTLLRIRFPFAGAYALQELATEISALVRGDGV